MTAEREMAAALRAAEVETGIPAGRYAVEHWFGAVSGGYQRKVMDDAAPKVTVSVTLDGAQVPGPRHHTDTPDCAKRSADWWAGASPLDRIVGSAREMRLRRDDTTAHVTVDIERGVVTVIHGHKL